MSGRLRAIYGVLRTLHARTRLPSASKAYARFRAEHAARYPEPTLAKPCWQMATPAQVESHEYVGWLAATKSEQLRHRKYWEWAYILETLKGQGMLAEGKRGLGFGVGREPLAALMASRGCEIVATDAPTHIGDAWHRTNEHARELEMLNDRGLCDHAAFRARVGYRTVDMNQIPRDLTGFDFVWSACAFEHLGTLDHGLAFVERSLDCVRPGGVIVHTTELNLSSNDATRSRGSTVFYRKRDFERLAERLRARGCAVDLNFHPGTGPMAEHIDLPPYRPDPPHMRLLVGRHVATSFGLWVRRPD